MANEFTDFNLPEFSPLTTKFTDLAENAETKKQDQLNKTLIKSLEKQSILASKQIPTTPSVLSDTEKFNQGLFDSLERNEDAWFDQSTTSGKVGNKVVGFGASLISDIGLNVVKAPIAVSNVIDRLRVSPESVELTQQIDKKIEEGISLTPEEIEFSNNPDYSISQKLISNEQDIQEINVLGDRIKSVVNTLPTDIAVSKLNETNEQAIQQMKNGDVFDGMATYLDGIKTLVTEDTNAAVQFTTDSLPYMLAFMFAPGVAIPVSAADINENAIQEFTKEHGRRPNKTEQGIAVAASTLSAGLDALGAKVTLGGTKALRSLMQISKATGVQLPKSISRQAARSVINATGRAAEATIGEGLTEAGQEVLEQYASKQDTSKIDPLPALTAGSIGAASGGILSAPSTAVSATVKSAKVIDKVLPKTEEIVDATAVTDPITAFKATEAFNTYKDTTGSIEENDAKLVTLLEDPVNTTPEQINKAGNDILGSILKNPDKDTPKRIEALIGMVSLADGQELEVSPETKELIETISKAEVVVTKPQSKIKNKLKEVIKPITESSEERIKRGEVENNIELVIQGTIELGNSSPENLQKINKSIDTFQTETDELAEGKTKDSQQARIDQYTKTYTELSNLKTIQDKDDLNTQIDTITKEKSIEGKEATVTKVLQSMQTNDSISLDQAKKLEASNVFKKNSPEAKIIKDYIIASSIPEVGKQIIEGGGRGNFARGTNTYKTQMSAAIASNDQTAAKKLIDDLSSWAKYQASDEKRANTKTDKLYETVKKEIVILNDTVDLLKSRFKAGFELEYSPSSSSTTAKVSLPKPKVVVKKVDTPTKITTKPVYKPIVKKAEPVVKKVVTPKVNKDIETVSKNINTYETALTNATTNDNLTDKIKTSAKGALKLLQSIKKNPTTNTQKKSTQLLEFVKFVKDTLIFNTSQQLRKAIVKNPIRIRPNKNFEGDIPKSLGEVFKAKQVANNIFQKTPDLFSNFKENIEKLTDIKFSELTEEQNYILDKVKEFQFNLDSIVNTPDSILRDLNPKNIPGNFKNVPYQKDILQDVTSYFINEVNGKRYVDKNLIGILSTVGLEWIGKMGSTTLENSPEAVQAILSLPAELDPTTEQYDALKNIGVTRASIEESLGNKAFALLGLDINKDNPQYEHFVPKFKLTLGQLIVTGLLHQNYLVENKQSIDELLGKKTKDSLDTKFIQVKHDVVEHDNYTELVAKDYIETIGTFLKIPDNTNLLSDTFGIENSEVFPSLKPITYKKEVKVRNSIQNVTDRVLNVFNRNSKKPWKANTRTNTIHNLLNREIQEKIAGVEDPKGKHKTKAAKIVSKNRAIARQLDHYTTFTSGLGEKVDKKFFFGFTQWSTGRMGMTSNTVNPLASKIHRHLISMKAWDVDVDPKNLNEITNFKVALAQSLGIKIEDTIDNITSSLDSILETPEIVQAVYAIQKLQDPNLDPGIKDDLQQQVIEGVTKGGEEYHSFQGLVELANASNKVLKFAKRVKISKPFSTNLSIEIDGKTNGIAFSLLQSGFDGNEKVTDHFHNLLNATGVLTSGSLSSIEWASNPFNLDVYKTITTRSLAAINNSDQRIISALEPFVGVFEEEGSITKDGRNFAKKPVLMFNFGAGTPSIKQFIFDNIIQEMYDQIATQHTGSLDYDKNKETQLERSIRVLTKNSDYALNRNTALEFEFTDSQLETIKEFVDNTYGDALVNSVNDVFSGIVQYRNALNKTAAIMFYGFINEYNIRENKLIKELGRDLIKAEKYKILDGMEEILPAFKGPNSENIKDSILVLTENKYKDYTNDRNQQQYGIGINNTKGAKGGKARFSTSNISNIEFLSAGIKSLILNIHHLDSKVQQDLMMENDGLNVHDAFIGSISEYAGRSNDANESFIKTNQDYHGLSSMTERLEEMMKSDLFNKRAVSVAISKDTVMFKDVISLDAALKDINETNTQSILGRDEIFGNHLISDQYVGPGSEFNIPYDLEENFGKDLESIPKEVDQTQDEYLKSSPKPIDLDNFNSIYDRSINSTNSQLIFNELDAYGNVRENIVHQNTLQSLLDNVINKVITPSTNVTLQLEQTGDISHGLIKNSNIFMYTGQGHATSNVQMSAQEVYVHELIHGITQVGIDSNYAIKKQIQKLFRIAKKNMVYMDFLQYKTNFKGEEVVDYQINEDQEIQAAKDQFEYIFNNPDGNELHEFVAYGLSNQVFLDKLSTIQVRGVTDNTTDTFLNKLKNVWDSLLDFFTNKFYRIKGQTVDQALLTLVDQLTVVKDKKVGILTSKLQLLGKIDPIAVNTLEKYVFAPVNKLYDTKLKNSDRKLLKLVGVPIGLARAVQTEEFGLVMRKIRRNLGLTEQNFMVKLVREMVIGINKDNSNWHKLLRKSKYMIDQLRKHEQDVTDKFIKNNFLTELTKEESQVLYRTITKTDLGSIFDTYGKNRILELLRDPVQLKGEIKKVSKQLHKGKNKVSSNYYVNQANGLGMFMAQGRTVIKELNLNANNIVERLGTTNQDGSLIKDKEQTIELVDTLATLFALQYTTQSTKNLAVSKIELEYVENSDTNGITTVIGLDKLTKENALHTLFDGNKTLMIKNYSVDITDPNKDITVAPLDMEEELAKQGYTIPNRKPLPKDPAAPITPDMYMYVSQEATLNERVRTIVSLTSRKKKGASIKDILNPVGTLDPNVSVKSHAERINKQNQTEVDEQFNLLLGDLSNSKVNYMVPVRGAHDNTKATFRSPATGANGNTPDYRYIMTDHTKQTVLAQDERIEKVMAATDSSIIDRVNSKDINTEVVQLAYDEYKENFSKEPEAYKTISLNSPDGKQYQELYKLLPEDMRRDMEKIWGNKEIRVREELVDLIFGFRKASLINLKVLNVEIGKIINDMLLKLNDVLFHFTPKIKYTGNLPLKALENKIQDVIGITKDLIVVKSGSVLVGNAISNTFLLLVKGVPITKVASLQFEAYKAIEDYRKVEIERDLIQRRLDSDTNMSAVKRKNLENKLNRLQNEINTNPVKELVDEGIFQSIIEDIDLDQNIYNTGSKIAQRAEEFSDKYLPDVTVSAAKLGWMSKDTTLYQTLFKLTQYGDFVSRYALYKHRADQVGLNKLNPKSKEYKEKFEDVIEEVVETFINYDIPTSPELQWLNDMGIFMFTKFMLRIQRIIYKTVKERPASSLLVSLLKRMMTGTNLSYISDSSIIDANVMSRIGTPWGTAENLLQVPTYEISSGL